MQNPPPIYIEILIYFGETRFRLCSTRCYVTLWWEAYYHLVYTLLWVSLGFVYSILRNLYFLALTFTDGFVHFQLL